MKQKSKILKLSANENFYGCSPKVLKAIKPELNKISFYPDAPTKLKEKIANKYAVSSGNVIVGAGSVRIIEGLIETFAGNNDEVLIFDNSFIAYSQLCNFHNKNCVMAPLDRGRCNPEMLYKFINKNTKLIFISNPNNPTGTIISHKELENLLCNISSDIIVAIDEAYSEYVFDKSFPDSLKLQKKFKNLIILHSFSKIFGLAGLRIGFGIAHENHIEKMMKKQLPFTLNVLAEKAAITAIDDEIFIKKSRAKNKKNLDYLYISLVTMGFKVYESHANFLYVMFENDKDKDKFYNLLLKNGILICDMKVFGQQKSLRITIGDKESIIEIIKILKNKVGF